MPRPLGMTGKKGRRLKGNWIHEGHEANPDRDLDLDRKGTTDSTDKHG